MGNERDIKPAVVPAAQGAGGDNNNNNHNERRGGGNRRNRQRWGHRQQQQQQVNGPFKGRTKEIEDYIFDNTGPHDAAVFNTSLRNIADHLQIDLGNDVSEACRNMTPAIITVPNEPQGVPDPATGVMIPPTANEIFIWKRNYNKMSDRLEKYEENMAKAYIIIYHQCSTHLKNELEASDAFPTIRANQDVIGLLRMIQGFCCSYDARIQSVMATVASHKKLFMFYQKDGMDNHTYHREFLAHVETIETYGGDGSVGVTPNFVAAKIKEMAAETPPLVVDAKNPTPAERAAAIKIVRDEYLAALMLNGCNKERYHKLRVDLKNDFAFGDDRYPKTVDQCLSLLNRWGNSNNHNPRPRAQLQNQAPEGKPEEALVFAQKDSKSGSSTKSHKASASTSSSSQSTAPKSRITNVKCLLCGQLGHTSAVCPDAKPPARLPAQIHAMADVDDASVDSDQSSVIILTQHDESNEKVPINSNYLLLDSQSTVDLFTNPNHITNIKPASTPIKVHCNKGTMITNEVGTFGNTEVYLNRNGIANVLSLHRLGQKYNITYDSSDRGGVFIVTTPRGVVEFHPSPNGLHYVDLKKTPEAAIILAQAAPTDMEDHYVNVNTVRQNYEGYTKHQIKSAARARRLMGMVASPSERDYQAMVRLNMLKDCPVTNDDIRNAHAIYGPDLASIRGKTVRKAPKRVVVDYVDVPRHLLSLHENVVLAADVMFVNGVPFLVSASRSINLITIEHAPRRRTASYLAMLLTRIVQTYNKAGFRVKLILMDNEFDKVKQQAPELNLNTTAANEHVGEIERKIRVIKERARGIICTIPYKKLPQSMLIQLLHFVVMWLNNFPVANGISSTYSPREIITRHRLDYKHHCRAPFGAYCETHEENTPTNDMTTRGCPSICLGPTGNIQGTYYFLSLISGLIIKRRHFDELPIPDAVIKRVEELAEKSGVSNELIFADRNRVPFDWPDNTPTGLDPTPMAIYPDIPAEMPGVLLARDGSNQHFDDKDDVDDDPHEPDWFQMADEAMANADIDDSDLLPSTPEVIEIDDDTDDEDTKYPQLLPKVEPNPTSTATRQSTSRYPQRQRKPPSHLGDFHLFTTVAEDQKNLSYPYRNTNNELVDLAIQDEFRMAHVCHYVMLHAADAQFVGNPQNKKQYGLKAGLRRFAERGNTAVMKELTQFHTMNVFRPMNPKKLTRDDRRKALSSLMFLTEKRSGEVKARTCANGSVQRDHIAKEEAAAPTVTSEAIFIQATVYAHENRDVATCDIPGAFLQADNPDYVLMRLDGILAELMVKVAPSLYRKYVTTNAKGKSVLYVKLEKAVYGMMKSALLFYRKLVADLLSLGYTINPYDPCVANKIINGSQMTICWHVDDLFIGHKDPAIVSSLLNWLALRYDTDDKQLNTTRGHVHDYLGMNIDFSNPGEVTFEMTKYIDKIITAFPEKITGVSSTPASDHLFQVRPTAEAKILPEEQARAYHHSTAQLLFLSRVRRDIQTTIAFLTTRVKQPDEDDWGKLRRVLKYLNGTRHLKLTLSADSMSSIQWYVDASHQTHDDCRGHTGALMTLGRGATLSSSTKQKINTKSSTESELVGLYDKTGVILWTRNFLEAQGYTITNNFVYQDNMSTLSLAKNGYISSSKRSQHIKAKYFFVKHYHRAKEMTLTYCPTETMWADVLTKPIQGSKFRLMRAFLMNCPESYSEEPMIATSIPAPLPISLPMKNRLLQTAPSPRECVETQSHGTKVPSSRERIFPVLKKPTEKLVTWKDHVKPYPFQATASFGHQNPYSILATAE